MKETPSVWWEQLDFLAPDVRDDLGQLMSQLDRGLPLSTKTASSGEPAGWAGLVSKGPWERLVTSEWAVAESYPEEFVRRADEGELGFWEQAMESHQAARSLWVWVDAGPDQLGVCRVVQLAILFWLQKKCLSSGGQFYWGVVQEPECGYEKLGADEVFTFLKARSVDPPRRPPERMGSLETWCLGGLSWGSQVPRRINHLSLEQIGTNLVELRAFGRRLEFELPASKRAVRLLRSPMVWELPAREKPVTPVQDGSLAFSANAQKLIIASHESITILPLPSSLNEPPGRARVYNVPWQGRVIAVNMVRRAIFITMEQNGLWFVRRLNPARADEGQWPSVEAPAIGDQPLGACFQSGTRWCVWVGDSLYKLLEEPVLETRVAGGCVLGDSTVLVSDRGRVRNAQGKEISKLDHKQTGQAFLARSYDHGVQGLGYCVATQINDTWWRIHQGKGYAEIQAVGNVVGLYAEYRRGPLLIVETNGWLMLQGPITRESLDLGEPVESCVVHPNGRMAYRTKSGNFGCYDLNLSAVIWRGEV